MKTYLYASQLNLGLTQRCNLGCGYCQCNTAKNADMPRQVMEKIFDEVKFVDMLYLMGGEISLRPQQVGILTEVLKDKKVDVKEFLIFSNGTTFDEKYMKLLQELQDYCTEKGTLPLFVSYDKEHRDQATALMGADKYQKNIEKLTKCKLFNDFAMETDVFVMREGRAKNYTGDSIVVDDDITLRQNLHLPVFADDKKQVNQVSSLTIGVHGDITHDNDFEQQQINSQGNVMERSINEILLASPMTIKCKTPDEYNEHIAARNEKLENTKTRAAWARLAPKSKSDTQIEI